jgi:exonuclease VII small subunit|tara:strand:- start:757 stop:1038 length:282 start_codon:yes stop_codon:yes gene_type:complete
MNKNKNNNKIAEEPKKITEFQLKELQEIVNRINSAQLNLGQSESQKYALLQGIQGLQKQLLEKQKSLQEEYGDVNINIQDGSITPREDEQANT